MKAMIITVAVMLLASSCALAGEVFGNIIDGNKPIAAGVRVTIKAGEKTYSGETDKFGAYRIFVVEKGKCTLIVQTKETSPPADLFSYDKSTRYDWVLETKEGKLALRRK
jgi:hypothetical protein